MIAKVSFSITVQLLFTAVERKTLFEASPKWISRNKIQSQNRAKRCRKLSFSSTSEITVCSPSSCFTSFGMSSKTTSPNSRASTACYARWASFWWPRGFFWCTAKTRRRCSAKVALTSRRSTGFFKRLVWFWWCRVRLLNITSDRSTGRSIGMQNMLYMVGS